MCFRSAWLLFNQWFYSNPSKIKKIYNFSLNTHGGKVDIEYQLVEKIKFLVLKLTVFLKKRKLRASLLKISFTQIRLIMELLLHINKVNWQIVGIKLDRWYDRFCFFMVFSWNYLNYFICFSNNFSRMKKMPS